MAWKLGIAIVVGAMLLTACGAGEPSVTDPTSSSTTVPGTTSAPPALEDVSSGTEPDGDWVLVSGVDTVGGYPITLSIEGTAFGGRAACNEYGGTLEIDDDGWGFSEIGMTAMACEPSVMDSEAAYTNALSDVERWTASGHALTLVGPSVELVFERAPEVPAEALVGTEWVLETIVQGDMAFTPVRTPATLRLAPDGTVTGSTGCRTLTGVWVIQYGQVFFPEFGADGTCPDDVAEQDSIVVTVLGDGFVAAVDGDLLTVTSIGGEGLVYLAS